MSQKISFSMNALSHLRCDEVFERLTSTAGNATVNGVRVLSSRHVSGSKETADLTTVVRVAYGVFDYEHVETLLRYDRPNGLTVELRPLRMTRYNPRERLPPVGSEYPGDPDKAFHRMFGKNPQPLRFDFDLSEEENRTHITVSATQSSDGMGWLNRFLWKRSIQKQLRALIAVATDTR
ncbi:hypothetical protein [Szabonella alba]|uniref:Polyketide cyclase / dehydrase and lipid transport n=1 Tax=Szabonella alba TaxID=2804194 RepID=A0A8K0VC25_9RHOB|nr:hypothetical protein [Szabonella alba]MBL4916420.1 hypothetical protein [Szabonella alba]